MFLIATFLTVPLKYKAAEGLIKKLSQNNLEIIYRLIN